MTATHPANLTASERARVNALINAADPILATRVSELLDPDPEPDPVIRALNRLTANVDLLGERWSAEMRHLEGALTTQQRQGQWIVLVVVLVSLGINAGMVGVGLSVGLSGVATVTTTAVPVAVPAHEPAGDP